MMNRSSIKQGTVFQVPLLKAYGYAYVVLYLIDTKCEDGQVVTDQLIRTLDYLSPLSNPTPPEDILQRPYLFTPTLMMGSPKIRGEGKWKIIGYREPDATDLLKPDFKACYQLGEIRPGVDLSELRWYRIKDFLPGKEKQEPYESLKHLGFYAELNYLLITYKLTMEWMIANGEDVRAYFTDQDFATILGLEMVYSQLY